MPDFNSKQPLVKTIRHLEDIKGWIKLEEIEEIDDHLEELQKLPYNEDVQNIITLLQFGLYAAAVTAIDEFIGKVFDYSLHKMGIVWRKRPL